MGKDSNDKKGVGYYTENCQNEEESETKIFLHATTALLTIPIKPFTIGKTLNLHSSLNF